MTIPEELISNETTDLVNQRNIQDNHCLNTSNQNKRVTAIVGDSIVKNLQGWHLSNSANHVIVIVAGATLEDMEDYLKPVLRKETDKLILHVGTNDLHKITPKRVAEGIVNLGIQIKEDSPDTEIVISSIFPKSDKSDLAVKAIEANQLIKAVCSLKKLLTINLLIIHA